MSVRQRALHGRTINLRTLKAAEIAGIGALPVHALDADAVRSCRHLGLLGSPVDPLVLALPVDTARKSL